MNMFKDKKVITYFSSVAFIVNGVLAAFGGIFSLLTKKKKTAAIFFSLAFIAGSIGAVIAYVANVFDRGPEPFEFDGYDDDDYDDFDDYDDDDFAIPVDDTVSEDEFKD